MSTQPEAMTKPEEREESNPGRESLQASERAAILGTALKLTKTKEVFFRIEIGFKRTKPVSISRAQAAEVQAPQAEQAIPPPVLPFPAGALRQAAPALMDGAVAQDAGAGSGSSQSGGALYVVVKGGTSQTPPDGYPPPP